MRNNKIIKSGLETNIDIFPSAEFKDYFDNINLSDFLVCSNVNLKKNINDDRAVSLKSLNDIKVFVKKASGQKCNYCWKISGVSCERKNCPIK